MGLSLGWVGLGVTVLVAAACGDAFTSVERDGAGAAAGVTTTTTGAGASGGSRGEGGGANTSSGPGGEGGHNAGGAGGDACLTCPDALASETPVAAGDVCSGAHKDAYVALRECICDVAGAATNCSASCGVFCTNTRALPEDCLECLSLDDVCSSEHEACVSAGE